MLLKQLMLAASAAAFLVIPEISGDDEGVFKTLPIEVESVEIPQIAKVQSLNVPCKKCRGRDSQLKMNFEVQDKALTLNGFELYPSADPWHGDLIASVVRGDGNEREHRLGYSLAVNPQGLDEEEQLELISLELRIIEVGRRFIDGIPSVQVKLIKDTNGELLIGSIDMVEVVQNECTTMACRIKSLVHETMKGFKGCGRHRHGPHGHKGHHGPEDKMWREGGKGAHHGEHHRHHSQHKHHWGRLLKNVAAHIFLPILMGVTAGVGVAVIAMALCSVAVRLHKCMRGRRHHRTRRHRCSRPVKDTVGVPFDEEEKAGLIEEQEDVPEYPVEKM